MQPDQSRSAPNTPIESLPIFVVLDSLYVKNEQSPIAQDKSVSEHYIELTTILGTLMNRMIERISMTNAVRDLPFTSLFSLADMIIYSLTKNRGILLEVMRPEYKNDFLINHSINVAFLSCKVAIDKGFDFKQLTEITVAGMLHDIGMARLGNEIFDHERPLNKKERESIKRHPDLGYQFFQPLAGDFPWLLRVVKEEHRRENNEGYPQGPDGELHPYSKIIGACDVFEALSHRRSFRKAIHPSEAMRIIIDSKNTFYSKDILRTMIESLSIYPVGSLVQLNNKRTAIVIESVAGSPLRPVVQLISDQEGNEHGERLDLSRDNNLYVTDLVYDEEYQVPENDQKPE